APPSVWSTVVSPGSSVAPPSIIAALVVCLLFAVPSPSHIHSFVLLLSPPSIPPLLVFNFCV
ncbi:hypothetical protein M9458_048644, partial [Cirrhinus mrigala]